MYLKKAANSQSLQTTLLQVAQLYYDENLSQQKIAERLKVSRSLIAQYLQRARDAGIVRIQIIDPMNACTSLAAAVKKATRIKHLTIIPNPRGSEMLTWRAVAGAAAEFLTARLKDGGTLGLAWGRTTSLVVDQLTPLPGRQVEVVPLMGESGHSGLHSQMNRLVMLAAERLRGKAHFLSLPMLVSSAGLHDALLKEVGIREVIMRWDEVSVACVGIGVIPPIPGMVIYIGEEHLPSLLKAGAIGDLCGVYYNRDGKIIETGSADRTIAVSLDQLKATKCVIGVACGENKSVSVLGALQTGILSALFIDQAMAEQILAALTR